MRREHNIIRAHSIKGINVKIHSNLENRLNNGIFSFSFTREHDIILKQNFAIHTSYRTVFSSYLALAKQNHTINGPKKYVRSYILRKSLLIGSQEDYIYGKKWFGKTTVQCLNG